jgi:hypothetical protein
MEQAMVAPRGASGNVVALEQDAIYAAQGTIAHDAGTGCPPSDDDYPGRDPVHLSDPHSLPDGAVWWEAEWECLI